jgi:tripartite-type tricarboxylate transporter receptor subunit TctC
LRLDHGGQGEGSLHGEAIIRLPRADHGAVYPGFESDNWYAMFFPAGTPRPIVDKLNAEIGKALKAADIREFMPREALDPVASTPEELGTMFRREIERYAKIIRAGNIKLD